MNTTTEADGVGSKGSSARRSFAGEMAYALGQAYARNHDRNPNRMAEVTGWLQYGLKVDLARRSREPIPARPTQKFI